ncbi:MAG TPA: glycerophosphodiester phosphodiesterase family protein [Vitreimonas sp.]|uniref:glycerophosphodiester phosphodiesterase family protein n=1 Tax=Vitreimonas sp. TaxID=3069702 RepID=UPI002D4A2284|nr:glycerophosphodiester phosphodiesterase family protein [Vitreimonas sp.]HYD88722.1 glycerophosphodiester phosphodiesterase family protein [Vitreimonas sp.]
MRKRWIVLGALALAVGAIFIFNASFRGNPHGSLTLLSHRGVHHDYSSEGLTNESCTAERIFPPTHSFIENTLPSMEAAFSAGADIIEVDIHPTTDGEFAVFHDWTLDCRTEGEGVTREQTMAYLRTLDLGYGYTADGGQTFPLRGQGVGMMPTLREVLAAFPDRRFLINFKGGDAAEADQLLAYLDQTPEANYARLAFYGAAPAERVRELRPELRTLSRRRLMQCAKSYLLTGWYGNVDSPCRNTIIFVPSNYGWVAWGWPNLFLERMQTAGSEVFIVDAIRRGERPGVGGIDDADTFATIPRGWRGGVVTDRIELIGPLAARRRAP